MCSMFSIVNEKTFNFRNLNDDRSPVFYGLRYQFNVDTRITVVLRSMEGSYRKLMICL